MRFWAAIAAGAMTEDDLSSDERENIALWRAQGAGVREIARRLKRAPSTISRELRRNASTRTYRLNYKASTAQWHAERRARRPNTAKLVVNERLHRYVQDKLSGVVRGADGQVIVGPSAAPRKGRNKPHRGNRSWVQAWSPEQIARRLPLNFPDDETMRISHEAIFRGNALKNGLLTVELPTKVIDKLWDVIDDDPGLAVTVDLMHRVVQFADAEYPFELDDDTRWRLINGLDDIALSLEHLSLIERYEKKRRATLSTTAPHSAKGT